MAAEQALSFACGGAQLAGILHLGETAAKVGVVVVVGGPQYRVGSHRQFVHLGRHLAAKGVPVLRFDVTGMGDSAGDKRPFDDLNGDIGAAVDAFSSACPQLDAIVLWGLCDGASAALMYAPKDPRVKGLILVNPWLESSEARAKSYLFNYYLGRLFNRGFWRKLLSGKVDIASSTSEFGATLKTATAGTGKQDVAAQQGGYQRRMLAAFEGLDIPLLWVLSGNDLTAKEFERHYRASKPWRKAARKREHSTVRLPEADHTFSTGPWKQWLAESCAAFVRSVGSRSR